MIDQELIEEQLGCNSTCVVILQEDVNTLKNSYNVKVDESNSNIILGELNKEDLKINLDKLVKENDITYLVIEEIDKIDEIKQEKYIGLIKDREFRGYNIPDNVIIVITIKNKDSLKKISPELYHFCVVAF